MSVQSSSVKLWETEVCQLNNNYGHINILSCTKGYLCDYINRDSVVLTR